MLLNSRMRNWHYLLSSGDLRNWATWYKWKCDLSAAPVENPAHEHDVEIPRYLICVTYHLSLGWKSVYKLHAFEESKSIYRIEMGITTAIVSNCNKPLLAPLRQNRSHILKVRISLVFYLGHLFIQKTNVLFHFQVIPAKYICSCIFKMWLLRSQQEQMTHRTCLVS